ncbi:hypothetical protein GALMADRAFT_918240 [Galerina marginata CBS 339.88]|uniref:Secreted protein n=1 Tax=Galerina marginata (strain CBS 339.88) TaxID=685588 RepID=A0A067SFE4_GALM3|nr:hypothetical protein GALMADRAFT_918240 [Galerina marginata CBS 339.88]
MLALRMPCCCSYCYCCLCLAPAGASSTSSPDFLGSFLRARLLALSFADAHLRGRAGTGTSIQFLKHKLPSTLLLLVPSVPLTGTGMELEQ